MTRGRGQRRPRAGFTLVEVMVALGISALLLSLVLSLWVRMSVGYRGQATAAELQQILSSGHSMIEDDLRQAGFQMPDGFFRAGDMLLHQPVEIVDNVDGFGPDTLRVFAADASAQARVVDFNGTADAATAAFTSLTVDYAGDFVPGDVAVIVKAQDGLPSDVGFYPCIVQIAQINGTLLTLASAAPWGSSSNDQCDQVRTDAAIGPDRKAMVYRLYARAYRIDPARRDLAVLQLSRSGGIVAGDWQDLAIGFTDLQIASLWDDTDDNSGLAATDTPDLDTDPSREWWSDATQTAYTQARAAMSTIPPAAFAMGSFDMTRQSLIAVRVTLVVRTHTKTDLVPTARTPALVDPARSGNNDLGNRAYVQLDGVLDASRPLELRGDNVYRYATVASDLRNMGVGL